jgi:hypothetical protein
MTENAGIQRLLENIKLLSQSRFIGNMSGNLNGQFDSLIFLREATPMKDQCPSMK